MIYKCIFVAHVPLIFKSHIITSYVYYTTVPALCQSNIHKSMCQVKVGRYLQNRHNAQNQKDKSDKGFRREISLSHFKESKTETLPENS